MTGRVVPTILVVATLAACGSSKVTAPDPPRSNGSGSAGSGGSGMITDEECVKRGGQIVTDETYAHLRRGDPHAPVTPFKVCHFPSPKNDASCRGDAECGTGRCFCTGALARPDPMTDPKLRALDGTPATGQCSDQPLPSGSWFCLVHDGKVMLHGIIVD
jgi:hypothetical protein